MTEDAACPKCGKVHKTHRTDGCSRCQGHSRQTHEQCGGVAPAGRRFCHWHGAKIPSGPASPNFRHGQYSKDPAYKDLFSGWMQQGYLLGDDSELIELREQIRLWHGREHQLAYRISEDERESSERWRQLKQTMAAFEQAQHEQDGPGMAKTLTRLRTLIQAGYDLEDAWADMQMCSRLLKELKNAERKRREASEKSLSMEQAQHFAAILTVLAISAITDRGKLQQFIDSVHKLSRGELVPIDSALLPQQPFRVAE